MIGCPDDLESDHQVIADALNDESVSIAQILDMAETNAYPDTYVWLKTELSTEGA